MSEHETPLDHIGWSLWQASNVWKQDFTKRMVDMGHAWFGEARGNLIHLIAAEGTRQSALVVKSQMTKQAVQQFLDELESDGIIRRVPDPTDARGKLVRFTSKGQKALADANQVKADIERDYEILVGKAALKQLKSTLDKIAVAGK
jgi:DNA-binding MarR family transcriptional regulator